MAITGRDHRVDAILAGRRRVTRAWPGLRVEYAWRPPFDGVADTKPNRLEVVFSRHHGVVVDQAGRRHAVDVEPGGAYVVGDEPTTLRRVAEYSDTLEIYPDDAVLQAEADAAGLPRLELEPTLRRARTTTFARDPALLGIAHRFRRVLMGGDTMTALEAGSLAHLLARQVMARQHGIAPGHVARLDPAALARVADLVEAQLEAPLTLCNLADVVHLSPFHFARSFRAATGLAPHQYVLARRIERAKRRLVAGDAPVEQIAWSVGFENLSHFRRQFVAQVGVLPGDLRRAVRGGARSGRP